MTIHCVTSLRKPSVTTSDAPPDTIRDVAEEPDLGEPWGRMRWARQRAGYGTAREAAQALDIPDPTYRTYERPPDENGRWPKIAQLKRIARRFAVSWLWLQDGSGDPDAGVSLEDPDARRLLEAAKVVDISKRADAINAAVSVLESFRKRGA